MLGQTANRQVSKIENVAPSVGLFISDQFDLAQVLPKEVKKAQRSAEGYKLFYVFENFLRDFVLDVLSEADPNNWWAKIPKDVQDDVTRMEATEEQKQWMALNSRSKLALTTLPQLLKIIEENQNWKDYFELILRDKSLIQEARHICHIRNTICHMSDVLDEEIERVKMVMRDWFRVISP